MREKSGITLIALVVTIVVLIILASVTIHLLLDENGVIHRAKEGTSNYEEQMAKEKLEMELANLFADKQINSNYNQEEYLTEKLREKEFQVDGNIVVVDGWKYEIDRSVPKIIGSLGKGNIESDKEEVKEEETKEAREIVHSGYGVKAATVSAGKFTYTDTYTFEESGQYLITAHFFSGGATTTPIANISFKLNNIPIEGEVVHSYSIIQHNVYSVTANTGDVLEVEVTSLHSLTTRMGMAYDIVKDKDMTVEGKIEVSEEQIKNAREILHSGYGYKGASSTAGKFTYTDTYTFEESGQYLITAHFFSGGATTIPIANMTFKINNTPIEGEVVHSHFAVEHNVYSFTAKAGDVLEVTVTSLHSLIYRMGIAYDIIK